MSEDVIRTGRDLAYQGTVLKVYKDHMKFSNGNTEEWDFIHHDGAAAVIPVMEDGKILMVKQYRNALERDTLEIPAGIPGEQSLDEDEFVDVKAYELDELKQMIFEGKIQDSKTMAAILAYESKYLHG